MDTALSSISTAIPTCLSGPCGGCRSGARPLIGLWQKQRDLGVNHIALNLKMARRPAAEIIDELGEHVLPLFNAD